MYIRDNRKNCGFNFIVAFKSTKIINNSIITNKQQRKKQKTKFFVEKRIKLKLVFKIMRYFKIESLKRTIV